MNIINFSLLLLSASLILVFFYRFQRRFFKRSYYSFYELITGLPPNLSFTELFFIKFLPPFIITFLAYYLFCKYINLNFLWYSLIGTLAAITTSIPNLIDINRYEGKDEKKLVLKRQMNALSLIYFFHIASFLLISGLGAYLAYQLKDFSLIKLFPSQQGLIDGLWVVLIISLFSKANKPLS